MKYKNRVDVSYTYRCQGCPEKVITTLDNFHLTHKCLICKNSFFPPTMSLDERLTTPIQIEMKK